MKAVVAAFNQEKALVGALSVITNLRMELFQALVSTQCERRLWRTTLAMLLTWSLAWTPYALMFLASGQLQLTLDKLSITRLLSVTGHRHFISNHIGMGTGMSSIYYYRIRKENIMQYLFSELFCKVSVSVNPFIYGLM